MRPFLLQDRDKDEVELVQEGPLGPERFFGARTFKDVLDDKITNSYSVLAPLDELPDSGTRTLTLLPRQNLPSCHDNIIQDLKTQDYNLSAVAPSTW